MTDVPYPCTDCEVDEAYCAHCGRFRRCLPWLKYYRTHQLRINAFAKKYGIEPTTKGEEPND